MLSSGNMVIILISNNVCLGLFYYILDGSYGIFLIVFIVFGGVIVDNGMVFFNVVMQIWLEDDVNIDLSIDFSEYLEYIIFLILFEIDISGVN